MAYLGRQPSTGVRNRYIYTATASQTTFSGADDNGRTLRYEDAAYVDVYLNGVLLIPVTDYAATTKTSIVLTVGATVSDLLEIIAYDIANITDTVSKANGGTFDADVTVNGTVTSDGLTVDGNLSVDGGTIKLDGNHPVGTGNFAAGNLSLTTNTSGNYNISIGQQNLTSSTSSGNTSVGYQAGYNQSTAASSTYFGLQAGYSNQSSDYNTGVGYGAFIFGTGESNTTVGANAGRGNSTGTISGYSNVAIGRDALYSYSTGHSIVAVGKDALRYNTTASNNTAMGYQAGYSTTTGVYNTAIGSGALLDNTTGNNQTAVGFRAAYNATGEENTAVGSWSLYTNTTGTENTTVGRDSMLYNTSGSYNVAMGFEALWGNTTASNSTAIGYRAGRSNTTGTNNTFIGADAGYSVTGGGNTFLGRDSGYYVTSGTNNTILGRYNGNQDSLDIRTLSNTVVLSDGAGDANLVIDSGGAVMLGSTRSSSGSSSSTTQRLYLQGRGSSKYMWICAGNSSANYYAQRTSGSGGNQFHYFMYNSTNVGTITTNGSSTSYNTTSDYRLKENVVELTGATDRLKQLEPKRFNFIADADTTVDGFLAHEVSDIVPEAVTGAYDEVDADGNPVYQAIDQSKLVPLLTQALKDAITKIEALEARVSTLENA